MADSVVSGFLRQKEFVYLLSKPEAYEDYPFGPDVAVLKVDTKMFATFSLGKNAVYQMNLKCDPDEALALRDVFKSVIPGYHMNKKHWNTVILDGSIPGGEIERMMDRSYGLVLRNLTTAKRRSIEIKHGENVLYK